jgi:SP family sugar:H+ symporter-like MFS transporter
MSEIAPRKVRGAIVSCYQFAITIGLLLASVVTYACRNYTNTGAYRIPIAIQFLWAIILATGLFLLPESPRYFVKKQKLDQAAKALGRVRGHPYDSAYITDELAEIQANFEYEMSVGEVGWLGMLKGGITNRNSNIRKVFIGGKS